MKSTRENGGAVVGLLVVDTVTEFSGPKREGEVWTGKYASVPLF